MLFQLFYRPMKKEDRMLSPTVQELVAALYDLSKPANPSVQVILDYWGAWHNKPEIGEGPYFGNSEDCKSLMLALAWRLGQDYKRLPILAETDRKALLDNFLMAIGYECAGYAYKGGHSAGGTPDDQSFGQVSDILLSILNNSVSAGNFSIDNPLDNNFYSGDCNFEFLFRTDLTAHNSSIITMICILNSLIQDDSSLARTNDLLRDVVAGCSFKDLWDFFYFALSPQSIGFFVNDESVSLGESLFGRHAYWLDDVAIAKLSEEYITHSPGKLYEWSLDLLHYAAYYLPAVNTLITKLPDIFLSALLDKEEPADVILDNLEQVIITEGGVEKLKQYFQAHMQQLFELLGLKGGTVGRIDSEILSRLFDNWTGKKEDLMSDPRVLGYLGIDTDTFWKMYGQSTDWWFQWGWTDSYNVTMDFVGIRRLNCLEGPQAVKAVFEQYNITGFRHYNDELLKHLYVNLHQLTGKPILLWMCAKRNYNNFPFGSEMDHAGLTDLDKYDVRVMEADDGNAKNIDSRVQKVCDAIPGMEGNILNVAITMHGAPTVVRPFVRPPESGGSKGDEIQAQDFDLDSSTPQGLAIIKGFKKFLKPGRATFIFDSCSTGQTGENSITYAFAYHCQARAFGPDDVISDYSVTFDALNPAEISDVRYSCFGRTVKTDIYDFRIPLGVDERSQENSSARMVYPNPTSDRISIQLDLRQMPTSLQIFDERGALVAHLEGAEMAMENGYAHLSLKSLMLPNGVYNILLDYPSSGGASPQSAFRVLLK